MKIPARIHGVIHQENTIRSAQNFRKRLPSSPALSYGNPIFEYKVSRNKNSNLST
jgi:hypothetical protein